MNTIFAGNQKGFSLTESMVAFAVTAVGLLAVASFQAGLFQQSAYNKARTEATALAQQKIEEFKHYTLASEDNYIDDNGDGVMDADGAYADNPINGQNAVFTRSWDIASTATNKQIDVTVSWVDTDNQNQSVLLSAGVPWVSPRTGADQVAQVDDPIVDAPTGRARLGEGNISDYSEFDLTKFPNVHPDGMEIYQHDDDLFLSDVNGDIVLTLLDACSSETGNCTDFVRISGTVYLDSANTRQNLDDILVLPSDAAYCSRYVTEGSLTNPPTTANRDYEYYHYTCYFGGGWHGNIGFVTTTGLSLRDKVCQGDPTAFESWNSTVIALRRAYRGMLNYQSGGETRYISHGIKDASSFTGHDFVFTELSSDSNAGSFCSDVNAPMTRPDSDSGRLFADVPTDFVCLNQDVDDDGVADYLDDYDTSKYGADTSCPFDPTSPPVTDHTITGRISVSFSRLEDLSNLAVVTSDGPGNCEWTDFSTLEGRLTARYACRVYDWGTGWTGAVRVLPNSDQVYCPVSSAGYDSLISDATQNFDCIGTSKITVEGPIEILVTDSPIEAMTIVDEITGQMGTCEFIATQYRCVIPAQVGFWSGALYIQTARDVCGAVDGVLPLYNMSTETNPHYKSITVVKDQRTCPLEDPILY